MSDSFVTQCPHCQTRFKVNHAQLGVARGMVRCGSCLQVFNAARQLLEQRQREQADGEPPAVDPQVLEALPEPVMPGPALPEPGIAAPQAEPSAAPPALAPAPAPLPVALPPAHAGGDEHVWLNELDLDDLDEELARLEQREIQQAQARAGESALSARRDVPHNEQGEWIGSLHNDDVDHLPQVRAEVISARHPDADDPEPDDPRTEPSLSQVPVVTDDDGPEPPSITLGKPVVERTERLSALDERDDDVHDDEPPAGRQEPAIREKALLDLTDDPLQLDWKRPGRRRGRTLLWSLLILLALGGLAGQYVWYHFDHLARLDQYRPWFQELCPQLGCKVPSRVDIDQLKSSNLVVRSHPDFQGALVVDAIIYNRASFAQPFPLLELRFADTSGQLIASRRFKPGEYLSGEMAGKEEMPPQTPIHIALDILDPGSKAVNYSLNFRSPE